MKPHRTAAKLLGFPRVPGVDVGVQMRVAVAEDLVVDALELRVEAGANDRHGFTETGHVGKEDGALRFGEVGELVGVTVMKEDAVAG
jgi:hypothetical protein